MATKTAKFEDNLVEFDYETWQKFGLKLYWPQVKDSTDIIWPLRILTIREHPAFQMVALVKEGTLEEVVTFSKDTGRSPTGHCILMDLDSLCMDPIDRSRSIWEEIICFFGILRKTTQSFVMLWWKYHKKRYEQRRKRTTT